MKKGDIVYFVTFGVIEVPEILKGEILHIDKEGDERFRGAIGNDKQTIDPQHYTYIIKVDENRYYKGIWRENVFKTRKKANDIWIKYVYEPVKKRFDKLTLLKNQLKDNG